MEGRGERQQLNEKEKAPEAQHPVLKPRRKLTDKHEVNLLEKGESV